MTPAHAGLARALVFSLVLHALALLAGLPLPLPRIERTLQTPLQVSIEKEPAPVLVLPQEPQLPIVRHPNAERPKPAPREAKRQEPRAHLQGEAARAANEQLARELFYPVEAVERGLEGEAVVLLFLDAAGNVMAARLERSSGHAILDDAAVRAARTLRALPESAPREALLPVRFRLR